MDFQLASVCNEMPLLKVAVQELMQQDWLEEIHDIVSVTFSNSITWLKPIDVKMLDKSARAKKEVPELEGESALSQEYLFIEDIFVETGSMNDNCFVDEYFVFNEKFNQCAHIYCIQDESKPYFIICNNLIFLSRKPTIHSA